MSEIPLRPLSHTRRTFNVLNKTSASKRALFPKPKAVDIFDRFNKQDRNADYSGVELFGEHHKTYKANEIGFGDYTVISSVLAPGGGKPAAVAIHATFKNPKDSNIRVEHFVSDETSIYTGPAESKYKEAIAKIAPVVTRRKTEFGANEALKAYVSDHKTGEFPRSAKNKEHPIFHHIALMHDVLQGVV